VGTIMKNSQLYFMAS
jgi:hypothetical protein